MQTYQVFIQETPIRNANNQNWEANLVLVGEVKAKNSDHAFLLAKRYCNHPVIKNLTVKLRKEESNARKLSSSDKRKTS